MTKRQLTEQEKTFVTKNLTSLEVDLEYSRAMLKQTQVSVEIAPIVYNKQFFDLQIKLRQNEEINNELESTITILKDQLENGVEPKDVEAKAETEEATD